MAAPFATADLAHTHSGPISAAPFLDVVGWLDDPLEWMHRWAWLRRWFAVKRCPFLNGSGDQRFANLNFINNPRGRGGFSNDLLVLSLVVATTWYCSENDPLIFSLFQHGFPLWDHSIDVI